MTIMELLDKLDRNTLINVGDDGGCGFYLIGTAGQIKDLIEMMPEAFMRVWQEDVNALESAVQYEKDRPVIKAKHDSSNTYRKRIEQRRRVIENLQKRVRKEEAKGEYIDGYIDSIKEKEVKQCYLRTYPQNGYNVLLKGSKGGSYWDIDEWRKDHGVGVNMRILYHHLCSSITRKGGVKKGSTWAEQKRRKPKRLQQ